MRAAEGKAAARADSKESRAKSKKFISLLVRAALGLGVIIIIIMLVEGLVSWVKDDDGSEESPQGAVATSCINVATIPNGRTGDFCMNLSVGETATFTPPPWTFIEVLPTARARFDFISWQDEKLPGYVVDPGSNTWPCLPENVKTITVKALEQTTLRARIGVGSKVPTNPCS